MCTAEYRKLTLEGSDQKKMGAHIYFQVHLLETSRSDVGNYFVQGILRIYNLWLKAIFQRLVNHLQLIPYSRG